MRVEKEVFMQKTQTQKFTCAALFDAVKDTLKDTCPEYKALDYCIAERYDDGRQEIYEADISINFVIGYGGNEGAYADFYAEGNFGESQDEFLRKNIGTAKVLGTDLESVKMLSCFAATFMDAATTWIREHDADLEWRGIRLTFYRDDETGDKKRLYTVTCANEEAAKAHILKCCSNWSCVSIFDNVSRQGEVYQRFIRKKHM